MLVPSSTLWHAKHESFAAQAPEAVNEIRSAGKECILIASMGLENVV
jgi:hypothetical protein